MKILMKSPWRKPRASNPSGNCVEAGVLSDGRIAIRDTRDRGGPVLVIPPAGYARFLGVIREGR